MTTNERFRRMYEHREADRVPFMDYAWTETLARWREEGLPTDDYLGYFDLDKTASVSVDSSPRLPVRVIEENDEFIVREDAYTVPVLEFCGWDQYNRVRELLEKGLRYPNDVLMRGAAAGCNG